MTCAHCHHDLAIRARGLCGGCYQFLRRTDRILGTKRLLAYPVSGYGSRARCPDLIHLDTCASCVTALRVEVSSAMRTDAVVVACPHRGVIAA